LRGVRNIKLKFHVFFEQFGQPDDHCDKALQGRYPRLIVLYFRRKRWRFRNQTYRTPVAPPQHKSTTSKADRSA
jgi:hypothetical protein